jgi:hypothetical protein
VEKYGYCDFLIPRNQSNNQQADQKKSFCGINVAINTGKEKFIYELHKKVFGKKLKKAF